MLDVHPPHHAANTWRDFFIHIATIVVGLLIAIGLEQTVEYFHHRNELREVRAQLAEEAEVNRRIVLYDQAMYQQMNAELSADIALLRRRSAGGRVSPSGKLRYAWFGVAMRDGAWQAAKQGSALALMPEVDLTVYSHRYLDFAAYMQISEATFLTMEEAAAISHDSPDGDLPLDDQRRIIELTQQAQGQLALAQKYLGLCLDVLSTDHPTQSAIDRPVIRLDQLPD